MIVSGRRVVRLMRCGRSEMMVGPAGSIMVDSYARDDQRAVCRTRVHEPWLAHNERKPRAQQKRDRPKQGCPTHGKKMTRTSIWFQSLRATTASWVLRSKS